MSGMPGSTGNLFPEVDQNCHLLLPVDESSRRKSMSDAAIHELGTCAVPPQLHWRRVGSEERGLRPEQPTPTPPSPRPSRPAPVWASGKRVQKGVTEMLAREMLRLSVGAAVPQDELILGRPACGRLGRSMESLPLVCENRAPPPVAPPLLVEDPPSSEEVDDDEIRVIVTAASLHGFIKMPLAGRRKISVIWDHFQDEGGDYASCNICKRRVSFKTSTTNLKRHVERVHHTSVFRNKLKLRQGVPSAESQSAGAKISYAAPEIPSSSSTLPPKPRAPNPLISRTARFSQHRRFASAPMGLPKNLEYDAKKQIDEALLNLFIWDLQPFSIVEDRGFVEYTRALNLLYHLPNKNYLSNVKMPALYQKCLEEVCAVVEEQAKSVCITLYTWTSRLNDVYLAIMAHFVGEEFDFNSFLLECATFAGPATSEKFAEVLGRVLKEWDLDGKVSVVVSEDDATLKDAVIHRLCWPHLDCYARSLNSIVQRAIHKKDVRKTLEKVRAVVSYFKGDPKANGELLRQQPGIAPPKGLLEDRPHRWDSTLFMIQRFSQLQGAIMGAMEVIGESDLPYMSPEEWQICSQLSLVLQPFEEVVAQMSRDEYTTASQILVLTRGLRSLCNKLTASGNYNAKVKAVISELLIGLNDKFSDVERWEEVAISTLLDPRFKGHAFSGDEAALAARADTIDTVTMLVREEYQKECEEDRVDPEVRGPSGDQAGRLSAWEDFDSIVEEVQPRGTPNSLAEKEVHRYLEDKLLSRNQDPFWWWKKNQHVYPNLAKLVSYKCNMLATALPCERIFSRIQNRVNERRSGLDEKELQQLLFLNTNLSRVKIG